MGGVLCRCYKSEKNFLLAIYKIVMPLTLRRRGGAHLSYKLTGYLLEKKVESVKKKFCCAAIKTYGCIITNCKGDIFCC